AISDLEGIDPASKDVRRELHQQLKQADYDYQRVQYNTVVSTCIKMLNSLESADLSNTAGSDATRAESVSILLRVLYPIVPRITWHLWQALRYADVFGDMLDAPWPTVDPDALVAEQITMVLQVNGKLRGNLTLSAQASREQIDAMARAHEATAKFLDGREPKRVIVVPGKLVNVVG